jgi:hypothetical protein
MGLGFGSLKQMSDSFRYNRSLLRKRKSSREIYKEEIANRVGNLENQNIENVRARVAQRLKKNKMQEVFARILAILLLISVVCGIVWTVSSINFTWKRPGKYEDKSSLFKTVVYRQSNGLDLKVEYFVHGPKAAETFLKNGKRHQNTESYYESGQQFRAALYYFDSLVTDVYFFKSGDTIHSFPAAVDKEVHRIKLIDTTLSKKVEFDFYDGKIIQGTYVETDL